MTGRPDSFMPLWIGDYLADTMGLTRDQHGGYLLLIMSYWRSGKPLPDDDETLSAVTRSTPKEWKKLRPILSGFFKISDGVWRHNRIDLELQRAEENYASKSERAKSGAAARWSKHASSNAQAMPKHASSNANHNHTPTENNPSGYSPRRAGGSAPAEAATRRPPCWTENYPEWQAFKKTISADQWLVWFAGCHPNGSTASIVVPGQYTAEKMADKWLDRLEAHFGPQFRIKCSTGPAKAEQQEANP
jgi:uncharacterized protein YdaU (DUF1376 family)